eukprot:COSAG06_NODE_2373_length_6989_cov_8.425399_8_plen_32_part_00
MEEPGLMTSTSWKPKELMEEPGLMTSTSWRR